MFPAFDDPIPTLALVGVLGYLLGSLPFGLILARLMGLGNLREIGSGNIGATNVLRTGNKTAAFLTLVFDAGKGAASVLIAFAAFGATAAEVAGVMSIVGHLYPVWLKFRGGKGVATFLGFVLALDFSAGLAACAVWLLVAALLRISSLAGLISVLSAPIWLYILGPRSAVGLTLVLVLLIWWKHRTNIARLLHGAEPRIGKRG